MSKVKITDLSSVGQPTGKVPVTDGAGGMAWGDGGSGGGGGGGWFGPSAVYSSGGAGEASATYGNIYQNLSNGPILIYGVVVTLHATALTNAYRVSAAKATVTTSGGDDDTLSGVTLGDQLGVSAPFYPLIIGGYRRTVVFVNPILVPANSIFALMITRTDSTATTAPQIGYIGGSTALDYDRMLGGPIRTFTGGFRVSSNTPPAGPGARVIMFTGQLGWSFFPFGGSATLVEGAGRATASRWRVRALNFNPANTAGSTVGLNELEFRNAAGVNVATGGTASASSVNGGSYPASNAFDGSNSTAWYSQNGRNVGEWIAYQFTTPATIYSIRMKAPPGFPQGAAIDWVVEVSDDGISWSPVAAITASAWADGIWQTFTIPDLITPGSDEPREHDRAVPLAANFTLQNANSGLLSDGPKNTGLVLDSVNSTVGIRMIRANGAPPALPYTIISRSQPLGANGNSYPAAIILRNSTNGRLIIFGCYNYTQELVQQWSSYTSFNANILSPAYVWSAGAPPWRKVEVTSTNITFYISVDGENWYLVATTTMAAYLNAIDEIGMGMFVSGGIAKSVFQSWEVF